MKTLLLDTETWDLILDASGNMAVASDPYALAQDASSACRLFLGELWYDTAIGVPYLQQILSKQPPTSLIKAKMVEAALRVPGVVAARCYITAIEGRRVRGQIQVTDRAGVLTAASF